MPSATAASVSIEAFMPALAWSNVMRAVAQSAEQDGRPEHEQDVADHGTDDRRARDVEQALAHRQHDDDQLREVAERGVE